MRSTYRVALTALASFVVAAMHVDGATPRPGVQVEQRFDTTVTRNGRTISPGVRYYVFLPSGYASNPAATWPTILFLHGAGEGGLDITTVRKGSIPRYLPTLAADGVTILPALNTWDDNPTSINFNFITDRFIVLSPQSPWKKPANPYEFWSGDTLSAFLDGMVSRYRVDRNRFYATGPCMGGSGCFKIGILRPEMFAAMTIFSGNWAEDPVDSSRVCAMRMIPMRLYQGSRDEYVPWQRMRMLYDSLQRCTGKAEFTLLDEGHVIWPPYYEKRDVYDWLLTNRLQGVAAPVIAPQTTEFRDSLSVSLSCATTGAQIRYTTNGANVDNKSTVYLAPFTVRANATVNARAYTTAAVSEQVTRAFVKVSLFAADTIANAVNGVNFRYSPGTSPSSLSSPTITGVTDDVVVAQTVPAGANCMEFSGYLRVAADGQYVMRVSGDVSSVSLTVERVAVVSSTSGSGQIGLKAGLHEYRLTICASERPTQLTWTLGLQGQSEARVAASDLFRMSSSANTHNETVLKLLSPLGGERFAVGDSLVATWQAASSVNAVVLYASFNGGDGWTLLSTSGAIFNGTSLWGRLAWRIPPTVRDPSSGTTVSTASTECIVRVAEYNQTYVDESNAPFTIGAAGAVHHRIGSRPAGVLLKVRGQELSIAGQHGPVALRVFTTGGRMVATGSGDCQVRVVLPRDCAGSEMLAEIATSRGTWLERVIIR